MNKHQGFREILISLGLPVFDFQASVVETNLIGNKGNASEVSTLTIEYLKNFYQP